MVNKSKEVLFATFNSEAEIALVRYEESNPSHHTASIRIMAIDTIANNVKFSKESVINGLHTLKNIPIVTLYKKDENNFGDHEMTSDINGVRYNTYPIGVIPESANQWIEEVRDKETGQMRQYLCSDVILWKRMKDEYALIKNQGCFSVSMEVGMVDYEFSSNKICEVSEFYFTAVAVLGNGVQPAFKDACINFQAYSNFGNFNLGSDEYIKKFEQGGLTMPSVASIKEFENDNNTAQTQAEPTTVEPTEPTEPTTVDPVEPTTEPEAGQQSNSEDPAKEPAKPANDSEDLQVLNAKIAELTTELEKTEAENGRLIADLTKENEQLSAKIAELQEAHKGELEALQSELDALKQYRDDNEMQIKVNARNAIQSALVAEFPELGESDEFKALLENKDLDAQQLEDKAYALVGRMERDKRTKKSTKQAPVSNRVPITTSTNTGKKPKTNSPYGGLLFK